MQSRNLLIRFFIMQSKKKKERLKSLLLPVVYLNDISLIWKKKFRMWIIFSVHAIYRGLLKNTWR